MDLLFILGRPKTAITTQTVRYGSILFLQLLLFFIYKQYLLQLLFLFVSLLRFKAHNFSAYLIRSGTLRAIALYPLNALTKTRDINFSRNLPGIMTNVRPAPGPDGGRGTSCELLGRKNSFIYFPSS